MSQNMVHHRRIANALLNHDFKAWLPLIKVPTLHNDPDSPYQNIFCRRGESVQRLIPGSEAVTLPDPDDNGAEFKAPELAEIILGFLQKRTLQASG